MNKWKVTQLENLIIKYATAYYTGEAEVSDEYFDSLVEELRELDSDNKILKTPGWGYKPSVYKNKYRHWYGLTIGSLDKIKEGEEIPASKSETRISAKLDGLSVITYFENGMLVQALTRGDGTYGIDVTDKLLKILKADKKFKEPLYTDDRPFTGAIRGEVVMPQKTWDSEKYASLQEDNPSANPRNYASGLLNRDKVSDDLKDLRYVVYKVLASENYFFSTIKEITEFLEGCFSYIAPHFFTDPYKSGAYFADLKQIVTGYKQEYPCDGLVFSTFSQKMLTQLDWHEFAYKFESESKEVVVKDITYNVTRTGRMAPLIWFDPVELSGAMVQKCTGFNADFILLNKIGIGSKILVQRANEVIPYIVKVIESSPECNLPKVCPNCGTTLLQKGVDLVCPNENETQLAYHFIETVASIEGVGPSLYNTIVQTLGLYSLDSLIKFLNLLKFRHPDYVLNNYFKNQISGEVTIKKVGDVLNKLCEPINAVTFIAACNITGVSFNNAKQILDNYPEFIKDICESSIDKARLLNIKGIGDAVLQNIQSFKDRIKQLALVLDISEYKKEESKEISFKVAITGALSVKRSDFDKELEERGIKQSDNFKEIKYLITNTPNSTSSKMQKAKINNVQIISEDEFRKIHLN